MATLSTHSDGKCQGGFHCSRCLGEYQWEENGKLIEEVQSRDSGGGSLAESYFTIENFAADRQVIANLEKELQAAFNFMDGGDEMDNTIWIDRILLGRLIQERTAIGRVIKSIAKFQRREIMHGLVKRGDLEDMAEPPFHGTMDSPLENQRF